ncbi:uncharacterized protein LOC126673367 isoform X2 [Mercurialis annua]|uniref:uncharacterized protein LOC126673367 isoform X2 n=1 Tax=Mercurialis annua TaxID=3986 RepID=UPI00215EE10C|nr:uncharacterized protein LOC126673367 isoform X2 [Mercurialis annua]
MPGNEVGDRIHNFFGQENLSQSQHLPEVVEGTWQGLGNNQWIGQRQIGTPFISHLKNHPVQQSADSERGNGGQSSGSQHGVSFSQSILRPEFVRSQSQNQLTLNGYAHGNQVFQTRQNEANFLGVDSESDPRNLTSRGFSFLDAQIGSGPELQKKNSVRMDFNDPPVNYDFLGGQQQMSSQRPGTFLSIPRQQSGINDMQLVHQQAMLKQMQDIQRQQQHQKQQLQQQEGRQLNSGSQVSTFAKQAAGPLPSSLINGIPMHDASNYQWQPELMTANMNWPQRSMSPAMQGSSGGLMFSPEQGQTPRLMGMIPQHVDQSLYGVPISGSRVAANQFSPVQTDKSMQHRMSGSSNSFLGNQYTGFPDQASMQDSTLVSRQGYQGKSMAGTADSQGLSGGFMFENLQHVDLRQSNCSGQGFHGKQDLIGTSETASEKTVAQVAPSQNVATLDPTEEKILFGSDDNLWESFGRGTNMGSGGYNMSEGSDLFGAFPSLQSGSWSALMQSAVAETSTADIGHQEEWSDVAYQSSEPACKNQSAATVNDSGKQQSNWANNRLQAGSLPKASPCNLPDGNNTAVSYNNFAGVKHSGVSISNEQSEMPRASPSQRFAQPFSGEGTKWLDRKLLQTPISEGAIMKNQGNEKSSLSSQDVENKSPMFEATGYGADMWKTDTVSNSFTEMENAKSTPGSAQVRRANSNRSQVAALPDSSNVRENQENSQQPPNGSNIDIWKHVNSSVNSRGHEFPGKFQFRVDKSHQTFESPGNSNVSNGADESHDYPDSKEFKHDSSGNAPHYTATSGGRENAWLDENHPSGGKLKASDHINRKSSGVRKFQYHPMGDLDADLEPSYGTKNAAHLQQTQVSQGFKGHSHGGFGQSTFPAQTTKSLQNEKGQFPGFQGETTGSNEMKYRLSGSAPSTSTSFDRHVFENAKSKTTSSSQNMLELLHKVDQSREHGNAAHFSSSDCNQSSEMHEIRSSAGSAHLQHNQSSTSQGFGLQLAPPSQLLPIHDHGFSSQNPSQTTNSSSLIRAPPEVGEKSQTWLASTSSVQALPPSHETSQVESRNNVSGTGRHIEKSPHGNFPAGFPPGFPYSKSHLQNQQMYDIGGQATNSQPVNVYLDRFVSQSKQMNESFVRAKSAQSAPRSTSQNSVAPSGEIPQLGNENQNNARDSFPQFPILESVPAQKNSFVSGTLQESASAKMSSGTWTNVSVPQHSSGLQPLKKPGNSALMTGMRPSESGVSSGNSHANFAMESAKGEQSQQVAPENDPAQKTIRVSQGKESVANFVAGTPTSDCNSTQREIEAFGRSLRPNNIWHQNYPLTHQVQNIKMAEVDLENRSLKRFKGQDDVGDSQKVGLQGGQQFDAQNNMVRDATRDCTSIPSGDSDMLNFSAKSTDPQDTNICSQEMLAFGRNDSQNVATSSAVPVRTEHSHISPQMAPSWFDQYGTFKNGQILPLHDAHKPVGRPSNSLYPHAPGEQGNAIAADANQHGLLQKGSTSSFVASEGLSSPLLTNPYAAAVTLTMARPKKRKSATSELVPWHRQVAHGLQMLNVSTAELDWSRVANRLTEKMEDEVQMVGDGPPAFRSKKRLILTTQLMQLLFRPPPASILSTDAMSQYESVLHFVARSTLGDACSTLSCAGSDNAMPSSSGNLVPEKTSERIIDQYFSKVVEDLISRVGKLENDILRLDKRASVLDFRVECQELEKYSVINRFAKFHGRGQVDGGENSSPSDASTNSQRSCLQRYVTALPMPRNLPDGVQCFSL